MKYQVNDPNQISWVRNEDDVLCDNDLCAEAIISEIEDIIYQDEEE